MKRNDLVVLLADRSTWRVRSAAKNGYVRCDRKGVVLTGGDKNTTQLFKTSDLLCVGMVVKMSGKRV